MAKFFIDRPIFAWVIALFIMVLGGVAITQLPISQYPPVAPPSIVINASYPGASAQTLEDSVLSVIEREMNGSPGLIYMESVAQADGSGSITLSFQPGTNADLAQVDVQNRLSRASPRLPSTVTQQGVRVDKSGSNFLLFTMLSSSNPETDTVALGDYASRNVVPELLRLKGIGQAQLFGTERAMRIWIDPAKMLSFNISTAEITAAIRAQNAQVASGTIGDLPNLSGQGISATVVVSGQLSTVEQFSNIILRANADGSTVRLKDVARVELGGQAYATAARLNGKPAVGIGVQLSPSGNALEAAKAVRTKMDELSRYFPEGMSWSIPYDSSRFVDISITQVAKTLLEAVALVFLVMFLFLQNFRATIITTMTVPVVLLGTFGILAAAGFSINTLTMFGMVLAIGLLVDDAIVVVENVERVMTEEGLPPKEATKKSMEQIQGALVGIALVLSAVLLPMAFFSGSTGVIYKQFSITIVSAMALSVLVALIFTPALCATMLKPVKKGDHGENKRGFFGWFNRTFDSGVKRYEKGVGSILRHKAPYLLAYVLIVVGMVFLFTRIPTSFLPEEDQGVLFAQVQTPAGTTAERTQQVIDRMREYLLTDESAAVSSVFTVNGFNFAGRGQSSGLAFIMLKPWGERDADNSVFALAARAQKHFSTFRDAMVFAFAPPAVMELGNATGFDVYLQDRSGIGHDKLMEARNQFLGMASQSKILAGVRPNGLNDEPQYQLEIDDEAVRTLGVDLSDVNNTLSIGLGASYVNDFIDHGRVKKVYLQGQADSRMNPEDLKKWYVRNAQGTMVPFSAFAKGKWIYGPPKLSRYNGVEAMEILGAPAPGYSSGQAMAEVEALAKKLPPGVGISWTGLSYEERLSGSQAPALYAISLLMVFLCLAALYESWSIPIAVMLVVPLGIIGALMATSLRGLSNDVYFQVGLLTTIGLASKNAILIVEFAKELHEQGRTLTEAAIEACRMRLRPIIMTSLAFVLGVIPLAISTGAGSGSQHAIGTGVIGGMITATVLAVFWVPLFFVAVSSFGNKKDSEKKVDLTKTPNNEAGQ